MAIKINTELAIGLKVDGAYCRVEKLSVTKDTVVFYLRKYVVEDKPFFEQNGYTAPYALEGENPFKQAYLYLKTLPEFQDAIDC